MRAVVCDAMGRAILGITISHFASGPDVGGPVGFGEGMSATAAGRPVLEGPAALHLLPPALPLALAEDPPRARDLLKLDLL